MIGNYYGCGTIGQRGYLWTPKDGFRDLPPPPGFIRSTPWSISNSGVVVGSVRLPSGLNRGCMWIDAVPTLVPEVPGNGSKAVALLSDGTLMGYSLSFAASPQCIGWLRGKQVEMPAELMLGGTATDQFRNASSNDWLCGTQVFGPVPGDRLFRMRGDFIDTVLGPDDIAGVSAIDINRAGVIAGAFSVSTDENPQWDSQWTFRYDGTIHALPGLPGYSGVQPTGINDVGVIVGRTHCMSMSCDPLPGSTPVLWRNDVITTVWDLLPDFNGTVDGVWDINNRGQLVMSGSIFDDPSAGYAVIIATPKNVPAGDISVDCTVDADDLALLLGSWGPREDAPVREADLDGDDEIGPLDLAILLGAWSPG